MVVVAVVVVVVVFVFCFVLFCFVVFFWGGVCLFASFSRYGDKGEDCYETSIAALFIRVEYLKRNETYVCSVVIERERERERGTSVNSEPTLWSTCHKMGAAESYRHRAFTNEELEDYKVG